MIHRFLLLAGVLATLCASAAAAPASIIFIPKGASHVFWKEMARGAEEAARQQGLKLTWRGPALENDAVSQGKLIGYYSGKGMAGMIVAPNASAELQAPLQGARQAGSQLVIVDSPLQPSLGLPYVGTHNLAAGEAAADFAARLKPPPRKVLLLRFSSLHDSTRERENGFRDRLRQLLPAVQFEDVPDTGISVADSRSKTLLQLARVTDADLVFTPNESTTEGTIQALQQSGLAGKIRHIGFDYTPLIDRALRSGQLQATVMQDPYQMGVRAVAVMQLLLDGKPVPATSYIPATLVTRQNQAEPAVAAKVRPFLGYIQR